MIIYTHGIKIKYVLAAVIVQYFFTVAGYLLAEDKSSDLTSYTVKRVKRLYPQYLVCFILIFIIANILEYNALPVVLRNLFFSLDEVFLVQQWFFESARVLPVYNGVTWYVSAMLFAQIILFMCLKKNREITECIICPVVVIILHSYMYRTLGSLTYNQLITGAYTNWSLIRAFMGLCVGIIGNRVMREIRERSSDKKSNRICKRWIKHIVVNFSFLLIFWIAFCQGDNMGEVGSVAGLSGFILALLLGIIVPIAFTDEYNVHILGKIGKYTYGTYLVQLLFIQRLNVRKLLNTSNMWVHTFVLFAVCTLMGAMIEIISRCMLALIKKYRSS